MDSNDGDTINKKTNAFCFIGFESVSFRVVRGAFLVIEGNGETIKSWH
uniref:Uncharacterized protein n=1 Tax=Vibrio splendidus TaxID=29497 RepID=A0A0H3ZTS7_VIBSP|nr:hypothetical protein [Vibrio splendidus]AKN39763.1 hypothetical protein [Vibrio splendidus]